jgi:hypothetical protein
MSPDPRARRKLKRLPTQEEVRARPSPSDVHEIVYYRRHQDDDPACGIPGQRFLSECPVNVRAKIVAVLAAVAAAPPRGSDWEYAQVRALREEYRSRNPRSVI